ncbi:methyltransferase domain-containing protein [Spongiivirga sp. MCCC 1A20706]|uniref:methyltransferase domain-containing protein n=1 Tax=Spongiivirga sp. MCCC 1A20706 TaxID=3160963 RepID=UPI0039773F4A
MGQIEIRHLKLIIAIEEVGTLKEAAKRLFLTPSALSHQLKELESRLNTRIFYREKGKLLFTPSGKELRDASKDILSRLDKADTVIQELNLERSQRYIHGYSMEEASRLQDQANSIAEILHYDSKWNEGSTILEAGCGVGAQTRTIATMNPTCNFVSVDISKSSLKLARETINKNNIKNVEIQLADIFELPYANNYFDHIFVCFILEHLSNPLAALKELKRVLKKDGTITVIEGDHGSTFFHPDSDDARKAINAQVILQAETGGNANIGRELYPLLSTSDFRSIKVSPRQVYVDDSKPELLESFIKNTFTAMIKGISEEVVSKKRMNQMSFEKGIADLYKTAEGGGTFSYTFFKAVGVKK